MFANVFAKTSTKAIAVTLTSSGLLALNGLSLNTTNTTANDDTIPSLDYGWSHHGMLSSFDYKAVRRGYQVYKEVCATCHSVQSIHFRNLVGVTHTKKELEALAAEIDVVDAEPNDEGEAFERPGKLSDPLPKPYANDEAGRAANAGALPPDLSLMAKARHGGVDYIFALMTGYTDAPTGKVMLPGLYYNPYFSGGAIAMPPPLMDGSVDFEDGTPATLTQCAKDVSIFLNWAAEPEHDERKLQGFKYLLCLGMVAAITGYYKRYRWSIFKTRKISYTKTGRD